MSEPQRKDAVAGTAGPAGIAVDDASGGRAERRTPQARDWRHLSRLFEQLPPHALEAEMSLLGSMLLEPQVIGDVLLTVRSGEDFFKPANGIIYDAMVDLYDRHGVLDIVQLNQVLADRDSLGAVGGVNYLVELANAVPTAANARHYARLVREKSGIRRLIDAAGDILYEAYHSPENAARVLEDAEQRIFRIAQESEQAHAETLQSLVDQTISMIESNEGKLLTGLTSGFTDLNERTHGLQRGEMIIIAARPSMGKTALALNIAEQMALAGHPVGIFSLEMSKLQLVQRLLSARSGVDSQRIRRSMLSSDEYHRLHVACDEFHDAPMFIDDTPGLTALQVRAKARRLVAKHGVEAIIVDYLQLMSGGRRVESRQVEISEISRGVKAMARELNVPTICLSQLNRAAEQREGHRPRMSDLRESGSLEQDADVVMMLHREEYYHQADEDWAANNPDKVGMAELLITKQRNGPTGAVKLSWSSKITRFGDFSPATPPPGFYEPKDAGRGRAKSTRGRRSARGRAGGPLAEDRDDDLPV